jgi:hypothetical protein
MVFQVHLQDCLFNYLLSECSWNSLDFCIEPQMLFDS